MGEWKSIRLKDIANKVGEKNSSEEYDVVFSNSALNGIVIQTDFFDKEIANKANLKNYTVVKENDFVYNPRISRLAPCGPINKNNTQYTGLVSPLYTVFRVDAEKCNLNYIEHYFSSSVWHRYMNSVANYGARSDRMNITDVNFFNLKIKLPNPKEQERIALILSTWDKAIELKEKLIEQKKEQKKGLMQKLLTGEVRLSGFERKWKEVKIKDLGTLRGGSGFPKKYQNEVSGKYPFFKVSDMNSTGNEKYMKIASNYIAEDVRSEIKATIIPSKSIIFAKVGAALLLERKRVLSFDSCIDNNLMALTVNKDIDHYFVYYLLLNTKLSRYSNVGALPSLNAKDVYSLKCKIPMEFNEQEEIAKILSYADKEIAIIEKKLTQLRLQKKGLMQLLLTGKVRVKV